MNNLKNYFRIGKNREKLLPLTVIAGIIIFIFLGFLLSFSFYFKKTSKLHYEEKSNLDYRVYLKENQFYDTPYLPKDKQYISALIDYIDADFSYTFDSDDNLDIQYKYYVVADLEINDTSGKNIYEKKFNLLDEKRVQSTTNIFNIAENVKIDYNKYNTLAKQFIKQYSINAKAKLTVSLYVDVVGNHENFEKNITDQGVVKLEIPLLGDLNNIEMDYDLVNNNDAVLEYSTTRIHNPILFGIIIFLMILDIVMVIYIIVKVIKTRDASLLYQLKLNKIKKEYDKYLSETILTQRVEDLYKTKSLRIVLIKNFEGLLDIRDSLKKPILYNEEIPGVETIFYIISDNIVYLYVMHVNGFRKKQLKQLKNEEKEIETLLQ